VLQSYLGIGGMPAFDVRNQCSGFLYSLATANAFIKSGRFERVLVSAAKSIRPASTLPRAARRRGDLRRRRRRGRGRADCGSAASDPHHASARRGKYAEKLWLECAARASGRG
jgi:acetyl-CoA acetyltransferase